MTLFQASTGFAAGRTGAVLTAALDPHREAVDLALPLPVRRLLVSRDWIREYPATAHFCLRVWTKNSTGWSGKA